MLIEKEYISPVAKKFMKKDSLAEQAYKEIVYSIVYNVSPGQNKFILNNSKKNCNGVVPVKECCYRILEASSA